MILFATHLLASLPEEVLAQVDAHLHPALPFGMEAGDVRVAEMSVPHGFVDDKFYNGPAVVMTPFVAAGITLALLITHDGVDDFAVVQDKVDVVANLTEGGSAGDDVASVHFGKTMGIVVLPAPLSQIVLPGRPVVDQGPAHVGIGCAHAFRDNVLFTAAVGFLVPKPQDLIEGLPDIPLPDVFDIGPAVWSLIGDAVFGEVIPDFLPAFLSGIDIHMDIPDTDVSGF